MKKKKDKTIGCVYGCGCIIYLGWIALLLFISYIVAIAYPEFAWIFLLD